MLIKTFFTEGTMWDSQFSSNNNVLNFSTVMYVRKLHLYIQHYSLKCDYRLFVLPVAIRVPSGLCKALGSFCCLIVCKQTNNTLIRKKKMRKFLPDKSYALSNLWGFTHSAFQSSPALEYLSSALKSHSLARLICKGLTYQNKAVTDYGQYWFSCRVWLHGTGKVVTALHGHHLSQRLMPSY